jgi:lysophospholipase L1-like esterase
MQTLVRLGQTTPSGSLIPGSHSQARRIVALGDSLVYGYGDVEGGGWVERLRRSWMDPDRPTHALYNLGIRGDGVAQVLQRLVGEFRQRGELKNRQPDRLILSVGLNDSARLGKPDGRNFTDLDRFQSLMDTLLDQALEQVGGAESLCFVGMVPTDPQKMPFLDCLHYTHWDQYRYKTATRLACEQRGIPYLDLFELWIHRGEDWWKPRLSSDGLHPNPLGYGTILQDVQSWHPWQQFLG